jgi:hypothetical protein
MAKLIPIMILESQIYFHTKPWQNFTTILNPKLIHHNMAKLGTHLKSMIIFNTLAKLTTQCAI